MSSLRKIVASFERLGYESNQRIKQYQFYQILDELHGSPFDPAVGGELWEQASLNASSEAQVQQLCNIIHDAQAILIDKTAELNQKINELLAQKRDIEEDHNVRPQQRNSQIQRLTEEIEELRRDRAEYEEDLHLVTVPFGITVGPAAAAAAGRTSSTRQKYGAAPAAPDEYYGNDDRLRASGILQGTPNDELKWLLWIVLFVGFFEIMMVYIKFDFLNLLVVVTVLSIFLLNYFDNTYMKVCIGLTGLSILLDIVWLVLYAGPYWNPPAVGEHSQNEVGYLRFIVFFTVVLLIAKMPLLGLLVKYREVPPDTTFSVSLVGKAKINLSANRSNLISRGLSQKPINSPY